MLLRKIKTALIRLGFLDSYGSEDSKQVRKSNVVVWDLEREG